MNPRSWTIQEILKVTTDYLQKNEIDSPRLSAEILLAHQLNTSRVKLYLNFDQPLHDEEIAGYRSLVRRRLRREPIPYITGRQEFWSLEFIVGPQVMIPRPESELLVEKVISLSEEEKLPEGRRPKVLELGTGCGALAISIARELEEASICASDISPEALALARSNAGRLGVADRIEFRVGDMWSAVGEENQKFDVILSNPPYIDSAAMDHLPPEVRDYEPSVALDGREEGMFFITKIIMEGPGYLNPGGWIVLEMDPEQTLKAFGLIDRSKRYIKKERLRDYSHHYRVVVAQKDFYEEVDDETLPPEPKKRETLP